MASEAHIRIDEGLPRGKRKQKDPNRTKPLTKKVWTNYPAETRRTVIDDALALLAQGWTTNEIGQKHNIPGPTVRFWLLNDETAEKARDAMFDQELVLRGQQIDEAEDALALGRAREGFRYWSFLAERRDAKRYGQHNQLTVVHQDGLGERLRRARERVIEPESVVSEQHAAVLPAPVDADLTKDK